MWIKVKNLILGPVRKNIAFWLSKGLNILFPRFCFNCQKEGDYLCQDCQSLLEITGFHKKRSLANLNDLYFVFNYKNPLIKKLIHSFKYEPFVKELGKLLSSLIIAHFQLMDNKPDFYPAPKFSQKALNFIIIPVPLHRKRLKWRGFNQAEILSKELAIFFRIPLVSSSLIKIKETSPQVELNHEARKENIKEVFLINPVKKETELSSGIKEKSLIENKNILLVDDVYTTGATMQECAKVLKMAGAKKIIGIVIARG